MYVDWAYIRLSHLRDSSSGIYIRLDMYIYIHIYIIYIYIYTILYILYYIILYYISYSTISHYITEPPQGQQLLQALRKAAQPVVIFSFSFLLLLRPANLLPTCRKAAQPVVICICIYMYVCMYIYIYIYIYTRIFNHLFTHTYTQPQVQFSCLLFLSVDFFFDYYLLLFLIFRLSLKHIV